jgi:hypothetical protein
VRAGPDWLAFVGNWMTEWERTGDTRWRDKIVAGVDSFKAMPFWMRSGKNLVYGYDPKTGKLSQVSEQPGAYNLTTIQGGAEVVFELNEFFENADWQKIWLQYCRLGAAPAEVLRKDQQTGTEGADASYVGEMGGWGQGSPRLSAYACCRAKNPAFAKRATAAIVGRFYGPVTATRVAGPEHSSTHWMKRRG